MAAELERLAQESLIEATRLREQGDLGLAAEFSLRAERYVADAKFFKTHDLLRFPREVSDFETHGTLPGLQRTRALFNSQPGKVKILPNINPKTTASIQRLIEADLDLQMLDSVRSRLPKVSTETILVAWDMLDQWLVEDMTYGDLQARNRERIGVSIAQTLLKYPTKILAGQYEAAFHEYGKLYAGRQHAPNWRDVRAREPVVTLGDTTFMAPETPEDVPIPEEIDFLEELETPVEDTQEVGDERLEDSLLSEDLIWPNETSHPLITEISDEERDFLENNSPTETFEAFLSGYRYFALLIRRNLHGEGRYFPQMIAAGSIESLFKSLRNLGGEEMAARIKGQRRRKSEFGTYGSLRVGEEVIEYVYLNGIGMRMSLDSPTLFPDFGPITSTEIERRLETALAREAQMLGTSFKEGYVRALIREFQTNERLSSSASKE